MGEIEPDLMHEGYEEKQRNKPDRVFDRAHYRGIAVGVGPQQQHLVTGPDRDTTCQRPEHVVVGLVVEGEAFGVLVRPFAVVFETGVLFPPDIEPHVPGPVDKHGQRKVAGKNDSKPGQGQRLEMLEWRCQIEPDEDGKKRIGYVPGKQVARKAEEPFHQSFRLWWP